MVGSVKANNLPFIKVLNAESEVFQLVRHFVEESGPLLGNFDQIGKFILNCLHLGFDVLALTHVLCTPHKVLNSWNEFNIFT